jgi:2-haloalkanoic acid dehalogenase type II
MTQGKGEWPKAVFTDSKNTLFAWDSTWVRASANILKKYGNTMDPETFWGRWAGFLTGENMKTAFGKYRKFTESLGAALMLAFQHFNIPGSPDDVTFMTDLWNEVPAFPDAAAGLRRIKGMAKVLIYSNVETEYLDMMMNKLGGFVPDFIGDMDKSLCCKPSPRAYRWVLETAGRQLNMRLDFPDVLYVAGPQWDVQGAMAMGMKGCWIHRPYRFSPTIEGVPYDYEVDDFHQVARIVEEALS